MKFTEPSDFSPSIQWLNKSGDVTISWDEEDSDAVAELVQKKMKEGFSFFIVREPGARGAAPRLKQEDGLSKAILNRLKVDETVNGQVLDDADLMIALQNRVIKFSRVKRDGKPTNTIRRTNSGHEVVNSQTIALRPIVGG